MALVHKFRALVALATKLCTVALFVDGVVDGIHITKKVKDI
jgi:hypothetical protein